MKKRNIGIIGFGRIGAEHAGWLNDCQNIRAVAAADPTEARRQLARDRGLTVYDSIDPLLHDRAIDAVLIATPTSMHYEHAAAALRAGKHLMIEKPMAMDMAQAVMLRELAESAGRVLSVFHNRRWDLDYLTVQKAIAAGTFGKVFNVESRLGQWASCVGPAAKEYRPQWRNEAAFGGGGLFDWGSHFLDQLWRLLRPAKPARLFAQLRGNVWTSDCDDFARVCIDFDNGAVGLMEINTTTTCPMPRWHIDGQSGSAQSPHSLDFDTKKWADLTFAPANGKPAHKLPLAHPGLSESQIWDCFADAIQNEEPAPAVTAGSVLGTMALLDAARESGRRGVVVELGPAPFNETDE